MSSLKTITILCGGQNSEHRISLLSASNIYAALDRDKYSVRIVGITPHGAWHELDASGAEAAWSNIGDAKQIALRIAADSPELLPAGIDFGELLAATDVFFPVLHGPFGEDGTVQGLLQLLGAAFVGPDTLGSAIGMDKDVCKNLLRQAGVAVAPSRTVWAHELAMLDSDALVAELGLPLFVKPARQGSSIGISRAMSAAELTAALAEAAQFDTKIIVESAVIGRELECAVLGNNESRRASICGEVLPQGEHEWYDFAAKYIDADGAKTQIPADLTAAQQTAMQTLAVRVCAILQIEGMTRVDCFLTAGDELVVNEVNTIPGFTNISMYPKLWETSGLPYSELLDELIALAVARQRRQAALKSTY